MLARDVAVPAVEQDRPDDPDDAEDLERPAPRYRRDQQATSIGVKAPLTRVASQTIACARSRSFTGSQIVSTRVRLGNAPASPAPKSARVTMSDGALHDPSGRRGEERPPHDDPHEHAARADLVAQPAARNFEQRVRPAEGGQRPAHLNRGQLQLFADEWRGDRDADAIDVGDDGKGYRKRGDDVSRFRGRFVHVGLGHPRACQVLSSEALLGRQLLDRDGSPAPEAAVDPPRRLLVAEVHLDGDHPVSRSASGMVRGS